MRRLKNIPAWLDLAVDRSHGIEVPEKTQIIKRIFEEAAAGLGSYAIASRLNKEAVPPIGRSSKWQASSVDNIIRNRAVLGEFQPVRLLGGKAIPDGEPLFGVYPAIIELSLFERAQKTRSVSGPHRKGRKGSQFTNLFGTTLHCAKCLMRTKTLNENGKTLISCATFYGTGECVSNKWDYSILERGLLTFLAQADDPQFRALKEIAGNFYEDPYARRYAFSLSLAQVAETILLHDADVQIRAQVFRSSASVVEACALEIKSSKPWFILIDK